MGTRSERSRAAIVRTSVRAHVTVARLLEAERPQRRQGRLAGKVGVAPHDVAYARPGNHIIIDRPAIGADFDRRAVAMAEVEPAPPAIVEEQAVGPAWPAAADIEWNRFVDWVGVALEPPGVGRPIDERLAAAVEITGLVAQPENALRKRQCLAHCKTRPVEDDRRGSILENDLARPIANRQLQSPRIEMGGDGIGDEAVVCRLGGNPRSPDVGGNRPAGVFRKAAAAADPHSQDRVRSAR